MERSTEVTECAKYVQYVQRCGDVERDHDVAIDVESMAQRAKQSML